MVSCWAITVAYEWPEVTALDVHGGAVGRFLATAVARCHN